MCGIATADQCTMTTVTRGVNGYDPNKNMLYKLLTIISSFAWVVNRTHSFNRNLNVINLNKRRYKLSETKF